MYKFEYLNYETDFMPILFLTSDEDDCPMHNHDYTELVIVISGSGLHLTEAVDYPIKTGDIFVIHKNQHHGYKNTNNMTLATILFRYDDFFKDNEDFESIPKFRNLFNFIPQYQQLYRFPYRMYLDSEKFHFVENMINRLEYEQKMKQCGYKALMKAVFMELIVFLTRNYQAEYNEEHKFVHNFTKVLNFIEENYNKNIEIESLAKQANMSYRNFQREFKKITKKSPIRYIVDKRLEKSTVMLLQKQMTISEIALSTGFTTSNYYAKQFKEKFRITPSEYKKENNH